MLVLVVQPALYCIKDMLRGTNDTFGLTPVKQMRILAMNSGNSSCTRTLYCQWNTVSSAAHVYVLPSLMRSVITSDIPLTVFSWLLDVHANDLSQSSRLVNLVNNYRRFGGFANRRNVGNEHPTPLWERQYAGLLEANLCNSTNAFRCKYVLVDTFKMWTF